MNLCNSDEAACWNTWARFPTGARNFSLRHHVQTDSRAHPAYYPMGTGVSLGVKLPGREANYSPPSSAEVKNAWSYTSTPPYVFMAWCLIKRKDNLRLKLFCIHISL
jgi:hypothetical protein